MENLEDALTATPEIGTAAANLDLEEERTEGKAVVAMPQLIKVLEAIEEQWQRIEEEEEGVENGERRTGKKETKKQLKSRDWGIYSFVFIG